MVLLVASISALRPMYSNADIICPNERSANGIHMFYHHRIRRCVFGAAPFGSLDGAGQ